MKTISQNTNEQPTLSLNPVSNSSNINCLNTAITDNETSIPLAHGKHVDNYPLKVAYILKRFPRFSETFVVNEILELERQGVHVEVFSLLYPGDEKRHEFLKDLKANITYLPTSAPVRKWQVGESTSTDPTPTQRSVSDYIGPSMFRSLFPGKNPDEVARLILQSSTCAILADQFGIQHLHAHFASNATTVALLASRLSGIPFSFTAHARDIYHCYIDKITDDAARRRKISASTFTVTVSDYNRSHLINLAGKSQINKIHRLYNGIDLFRFGALSRRESNATFIGVGRLVEKKGFSQLVSACDLLRKAGHTFRCLIVGDGPLRAQLEDQITRLELNDLVTLTGSLTQGELIELASTASAIVLPCTVTASGDRDGLPTVLLEAMAMRLPVISTTVAGIPEIIDHNRTGLLVPPENPTELSGAMALILDKPHVASKMGEAGRRRAFELFDLEKNVAELVARFRQSVDSASNIYAPIQSAGAD